MATKSSARRARPIGLAALRGFEAAARRLSFTLAAEELSLTQSSVSRQIAALERQLGRSLFVRRTRALELTAAGTQLQQAVQQAIATIDQSVDEIRGAAGARRVTLTTYASFASLWLAPRLAAFQRAHPDIEIRLDASDRVVDLRAEGVDLAVRWLPADRLPAGALALIDDVAAPALSPGLLAGARLRGPADLARWPLLELDTRVPGTQRLNWQAWFAFAGAGQVEPAAGRLVFSFVDQAVQAAVRGQGVALVRSPFLQDAVASGDLVMPFPQLCMPAGYRHVLVVDPAAARRAPVEVFVDWLTGQFRQAPRLSG
ncbi:MAG: LysR family transcriptional regulator [Burkholderiales bacterium]|nr:LysR family transcriptional regulator [Burkholderiales bacterium]